jgi:hypothetical protein
MRLQELNRVSFRVAPILGLELGRCLTPLAVLKSWLSVECYGLPSFLGGLSMEP